VSKRANQSIQRICFTGLLQGLRPEERYALDWDDLDVGNRTITVNSAYVSASAKHGGNQEKSTKTELSTRTIPMHPKFAEWLETVPGNSGPFIKGADGGRITPHTAQNRWRKFLDDNPDVAPVTIENMRHSFATAYLDAGGRIEVLSRMLGHSNIHTTINRYYKPDIEHLRDDIFV
jgi:integrase